MLSILSIMLCIQLSLGSGNNGVYELPEEKIETHFEDQYYLAFGTEIYIYESLYVKGSAKILLYFGKEISAFPAALSSFLEVGFLLNGIRAGWRHFCTHPIVPWYAENTFIRYYDEAGDEFFIQYETDKIKIF